MGWSCTYTREQPRVAHILCAGATHPLGPRALEQFSPSLSFTVFKIAMATNGPIPRLPGNTKRHTNTTHFRNIFKDTQNCPAERTTRNILSRACTVFFPNETQNLAGNSVFFSLLILGLWCLYAINEGLRWSAPARQ